MAGVLRLREIILNIAYNACEGKNNLVDSVDFTYTRAVNLITIVVVSHLGQFFLIVLRNWIFPIKSFNVFSFFILLAAYALLVFLVYAVFPKKLLHLDVESRVDSIVWHPKILAFSYLIVNVIVLAFLFAHFDKMAKIRLGIIGNISLDVVP